MKLPNILLYGSTTCPDTIRARDFLDAHGASFEFKDVDATPEFNDYVASLNGGKRVIPTLRMENHTLINPSDDELSQALNEARSQT
jgi:glutaredoxin